MKKFIVLFVVLILNVNVVFAEKMSNLDVALQFDMLDFYYENIEGTCIYGEMNQFEGVELVVKVFEMINGQNVLTYGGFEFSDTEDIYALKAKALGIIDSNNENQFEGEALITRRAFSVMLLKALELGYPDFELVEGKDYSITEPYEQWSEVAVQFAHDRRIFTSINDYVTQDEIISPSWAFELVTRILDGQAGKVWTYKGLVTHTNYKAVPTTPESDLSASMGYSEKFDDFVYGIWSKKKGDFILPLNYEYVLPYGENLYRVDIEKKYGVIDGDENLILPIEYDELIVPSKYEWHENPYLKLKSSYDSYYIWLKKDGKFGLATYDGTIVLKPVYDHIEYAEEDFFLVVQNGKYKFINSQGENLETLDYDEVKQVRQYLFKVKKNDKYGLVNKSNQLIAPIEYDDMEHYRRNLISVVKNGHYGLLDTSGRVVAEPQYDKGRYSVGITYRDGLALVEKDSKVGLLDRNGNEVIKVVYDKILFMDNGTLRGFQGDREFEFTSDDLVKIRTSKTTLAETDGHDINVASNENVYKILEKYGTIADVSKDGHFTVDSSGFRYYKDTNKNKVITPNMMTSFGSGRELEISIDEYNEVHAALINDYLIEVFGPESGIEAVIERVLSDMRATKGTTNLGRIHYAISTLEVGDNKYCEVGNYNVEYDQSGYFHIIITY